MLAIMFPAAVIVSGESIDWTWSLISFAIFFSINFLAKTVFFLALQRCLLNQFGFPDQIISEIESPRWHLPLDWRGKSVLSNSSRVKAAKFIDITCRKGGHIWGHGLSHILILPVIIGRHRTLEAAAGAGFIVFFGASFRASSIYFLRNPVKEQYWKFSSRFLFGAGPRIRDGRVAQLNVLIAGLSSAVGRVGVQIMAHYLLPPESETPELWALALNLVFLPLTFGDAMGEIIGTPLGKHQFNVRGMGEINKKSLEGCLAVFVFSLIPCLVFVYHYCTFSSLSDA